MLERHGFAEEPSRGIDTLRIGTPVSKTVFGELEGGRKSARSQLGIDISTADQPCAAHPTAP